MIFFGIYTTSVSIMQGVGLTKIIMITGIISNALNILLDYLLIFGKLGFPKMGIEGAALASVISITAAVPIITIYVLKYRRMPFKINFNDVIKAELVTFKQAVSIGFKATFYSLMFCVVFAALFILFTKNIMGIFTNDVSFIETASKYFLIVAITMFPKALNIIMGHGIRGMGDTKWMMYTQIFGTIFVIVLAYILLFHFNLGLMGIFITFLADETIRGLINMFRFWLGREFYMF